MILFSVLFACSSSALRTASSVEGASAERVTSALVLSEVADRPDGVKFVEICNRSDTALSLGDSVLRRYANGSTEPRTLELPDIELPAGQAFVVTELHRADDFRDAYGFAAGAASTVASGNGDDVYELSTDGRLDRFGEVGVDGTDTDWDYQDATFERDPTIVDSRSVWLGSEWVRSDAAAATPGRCTAPAAPAGLVINELADVPSTPELRTYKYLAVCNTSTEPLSLEGHTLEIFSNGNTSSRALALPDTVLAPEAAFVIANNPRFETRHGAPDQLWGSLTGNGDDVYRLSSPAGIVDQFGIVGERGGDWDYDDLAVRRVEGTQGTLQFSSDAWLFDVSPAPFACPVADPCQTDLSGGALRAHVRSLADVTCGYDNSREFLFGELYAHEGVVECRYTDAWAESAWETTAGSLNTEHVWPQSLGAGSGYARCDLNHLLPTDLDANAVRSSYPFGEVVDVEWAVDGSALGLDASGDRVFEPSEEVKGDIARALLYMHATYAFDLDPLYKARMQRWSAADPVGSGERDRNARIAAEQGSGNALVECPNWVDRL